MHPRTVIIAALLSAACSPSPSGPSKEVASPAPAIDWPARGAVHWASFHNWDDTRIAEVSRSSMVILPADFCLSPAAEEIIGAMREANPDLRIIGYHLVLAVPELYPDTLYLERVLPYALDLYRLVRGNWAWTTTGDTLSMWPGQVFLDPIGEDGPDEGLIAGIAGLLESHVEERPWALDGIMHDFFMYEPYISPWLDGRVEGEIDLDGDGVPIGSDQDEKEAFYRWQIEYVREIGRRLGPDFIQIGNGKPPQEDAELAGMLNGIFYELFPNMCWSLTDLQGTLALLDHQSEGWLREARGRTWSILTNSEIEYNNQYCLIASLLAGCHYTELHGTYLFSGWEFDLEPGKPLSDVVVEGRPDSAMTIRRLFSGGEARIRFGAHGGRIETSFIENDPVVR